MTARCWQTAGGEYGLSIGDECWATIEQQCSKADRAETGGILIGYYTNDRAIAIVTTVLGPPEDSESGPTWFRRGIAGLSAALRRLWYQERKSYYVGEWHYHPSATVDPSRQDMEQMVSISNASNYQCREPIMLLVGKAVNRRRPAKAVVFPSGQLPLEMARVDMESQDRTSR